MPLRLGAKLFAAHNSLSNAAVFEKRETWKRRETSEKRERGGRQCASDTRDKLVGAKCSRSE